MAYRKVGIKAVFDITEWMRDTGKWLQSLKQVNSEVTSSATKMSTLDKPIKAVSASLGSVASVAGGIIASQAILGIADQLASIVVEAGKASNMFTLLEARFKTLAARDYMRQTGASVEEALEKTSNAAQENLEWLRKMSVTTPFSVKSLANMTAYAQAAGFSSQETKRLSQTIGDFSAGMGLQQEHIDRIIWNFSQMMSAGRVLGRELRDLGNSMVPVDYIIEKLGVEFGKSKEEIKEMLQSGAISARKFIDTFNEMSEKEFAGAMERLSRTLPVALTNIQDFIDTMLGLDILKPTFDEVGGMLADLLDQLLSEDARRATKSFGFSLRYAFLTVRDALDNEILPAIGKFFQALGAQTPTIVDVSSAIMNMGFAFQFVGKIFSSIIGEIAKIIASLRNIIASYFTKLSDDAEGWGKKFLSEFAKGIASAVSYVVQALTAVAKVITKWLKPHSPPLILPDIDVWGAGTMQAYLDGWKTADYSVFDDISDMISKYVKAFTEIPKESAIALILGGREEAINAISQFREASELPTEAINAITDAAGISNEAMSDYLASLFKLKQVTQDAADAEAILSFELGKSAVIYGEIVSSLEDAKKAAYEYQGAGRSAILSYLDSLEDLAEATDRANIAQQELNDVTSYYEGILSDLKAQQNDLYDAQEDAGRLREIDKALNMVILTAEERERLELEKKGILLKRQIRDTEEAKDVAVDSAKEKYDAAKAEMALAEENARIQKELAKDIAKTVKEQVEEQTKAYKELLNIMLDNRELLNDMSEEKAKKGSGGEEAEAIDVASMLGFDESDLTDVTQGVEDAINSLYESLKKEWDALWKELSAPFAGIGTLFDQLAKWAETANSSVQTNIPRILEVLTEKFAPELENLAVSVSKNLESIRTTWEEVWADVATVVEREWDRLLKTFQETPIGEMMSEAFRELLTVIPIVGDILTIAVNILTGTLGVLLSSLFVAVTDTIILKLTKLKDTIEGDYNLGSILTLFWESLPIVTVIEFLTFFLSSVVEAIITFPEWDKILKKFVQIFLDVKAEIIKFFEVTLVEEFAKLMLWLIGQAEELNKRAVEMVASFISGFGTIVSKAKEKVQEMFSEVRTKLRDYVTDFKEFGKNLVLGLIEGLLEKASALYNTIANIVNIALGRAKEESETTSPSRKYKELGANWVYGLVDGVESNAGRLYASVAKVVDTAMEMSQDLVTAGTENPQYYETLRDAIGDYNSKINMLNNDTQTSLEERIRQYNLLAEQYNAIINAQNALSSRVASSAVPTSTTTTYNQYINMNMQPTYKNYESPSNVRLDMSAALASIRR